LAATVLCLFCVIRVASIIGLNGQPVTAAELAQLPLTVALFVLPVLYVFPGTRPVLARHRWLVLVVQGTLTWVPFALFGGGWQVGIGGLLAGLVLLSFAGPVPWLAAAGLLAADVAVRAGVTGLPWTPGWSGALWAVLTFVDDAAALFGLVRLAQLVGSLREAQDRHAELAAATERAGAAEVLRAAVGERLAAITAAAAVARQALPEDREGARAQVTAAGAMAREAVAGMRAVTSGRRGQPPPEPAPTEPGSPSAAVIGTRLAWVVLVVVLFGYAIGGLNDQANQDNSPWLVAALAFGSAAIVALQLYHSWARRDGGKPRAWPLTLGLQAALVYMFFLPPIAMYATLAPFLAGSVLLLVPGRWRWTGYAAVTVSWAALATLVPLHGIPASEQTALAAFYFAAGTAGTGLLAYGLSRLVGIAREAAVLRGQLTRMAVVRERLRVARDVHDLLGLGLSAIALKTDLIDKLIGRDDGRAAAELDVITRICASARADIGRVTGGGQRLSLAAELAAARQLLTSAGIDVRAAIPAVPLPPEADAVLAPVLREAVTNILRHSAATAATIKVIAADGTLRLAISNDGAAPAGRGSPPGRAGHGLENLTARVRSAGGRLAAGHADGRFELTADIPLSRTDDVKATAPRSDGATDDETGMHSGATPGSFEKSE
jgi:two-component system sensor histidine kinase DesK